MRSNVKPVRYGLRMVLMRIEDVFEVPRTGPVVTGRATGGSIRPGDMLWLDDGSGQRRVLVHAIERGFHRTQPAVVHDGDNCALVLTDLTGRPIAAEAGARLSSERRP